jgi:hypothetical protein
MMSTESCSRLTPVLERYHILKILIVIEGEISKLHRRTSEMNNTAPQNFPFRKKSDIITCTRVTCQWERGSIGEATEYASNLIDDLKVKPATMLKHIYAYAQVFSFALCFAHECLFSICGRMHPIGHNLQLVSSALRPGCQRGACGFNTVGSYGTRNIVGIGIMSYWERPTEFFLSSFFFVQLLVFRGSLFWGIRLALPLRL